MNSKMGNKKASMKSSPSSSSLLSKTNTKKIQKKITKKTTLTTSTRKVSANKSRKIAPTKKRLMLEVPATPTIIEVGSLESTTTFDMPTTTVAFTHPLPSVEVATHPLISKPTSKQGQVFAIVDINGAQHKVAKDDQIMVNHLKGVPVGEQIGLEHVYLIGGRDFTVLGKPYVPNVQVVATVEQHTLLSPITIWKHKRRTGYRKLNRHRDHVTILRIDDVLIDQAQQFLPKVTSLDTIPLNQIQEGGKLLQKNSEDV